MSLALYRTYRPGRFADVIGQEHVTVPLSRALANDRVHHAYLFTGPRGCGKTSSARILARSLNCEQGPTAEPCGVCGSCRDLEPNGPGSLDVIELDAASHGGVDDTRDLRERAMFAPVSSRYKIYIIDEAHMVTTAGFNALLKLIEEPPAHVRFVFATTEADKVLPTIRSRTHHYAFRLVPTKVLAEHLAGVCDAEGIGYEPAALALVARAGEGSVRDSLSILGQLIGGAGDTGITYADAVTQLGFTADTLLDEVVGALAAGDGQAMFAAVERVVSAGHDPRRFVTDLLERLRDLIVLAAAPEAAQSGLIDAPSDRLDTLLAEAQSLGLGELSRAADLVSAGLSDIKGATAPRLQLELLAARLLLPAADDADGGTRARLDRIERRMTGLDEGLVLPAPGAGAPPARPEAVASVTPAAPAAPPAAPRAATGGAARPDAAAAGPGVGAPPPRLSSVAPTTASPVAPVTASDVPASAGTASDRTASDRTASDRTASDGPASEEPVSAGAAPPSSAGDATTSLEPGDGVGHGAPGPAADGAAAPASGADLGALRTMWPAMLEKLKLDSRVAWTMFERSVPLSVSADTVAVGVPEQSLLIRARERGDDSRLREAILAVLHVDLRADLVLDPSAARATAGHAAAGLSSGAAAPAAAPDDASGAEARAGTGESSPAPTAHGDASHPTPAGDPTPAPTPDEPTASQRRAAAVAAVAAEPSSDPVVDAPSDDDPDVDALSGVDLIARELGATVVTEYDGG